MKVRLGYVGGPGSMKEFRYSKTMTYKEYQKLGEETAKEKLDKIIKDNLTNLLKTLKMNHFYQITFYRLSSSMIPLATHPKITFDYITPYQKEWQKIAGYLAKHSMRMDMHPDQFCILNSTKEEVVQKSITYLNYHHNLLQALNLKNAKLILHIGSGEGGKEASLKRFSDNFRRLPLNLKQEIILENDDKIYTVKDTLKLCQELNIPMVLDYHHYLCLKKGEKLKDDLKEIFATWKNTGMPPKVHFSSPKSKKEFRSHSDYANLSTFLKFLKEIEPFTDEVDIMLECKAKEEALFRLMRQLRFLTNVKIINNTCFCYENKK